jgi:PmbA protein
MTKNRLQHSSNEGLKSMDAVHDLLENALGLCHKNGATDAEVDLNYDEGFDVDVRMGEVEALSFHQKQGIGVTVYVGQRKGSASSTDLSDSSLEMIVKAACDMAKVSAEDACYGLADASYWKTLKSLDLDLYHPWDITPELAIKKAIELETLARLSDKRIINSDGSNLSTYKFMSASINSRGFFEYLKSTRHGMSCSLVGKMGEDMQTDYAYTTSRCAKDLDGIPMLADLAATRVCERLGGKSLSTRKVPVIFSNRLSSGLIGQLITAISGAQLYRKNSFLCESLNQKIGPEFLHIQEHPFLKRGLGSGCYDSDGIPTRENIFLEGGVINQYALGVYSARRLQLETTGNADGVHNLHVRANTNDLHSLLNQMNTGFLVTDLMGQGVNILTGDYSRGASGFWVENGKIQYPVEGVTIAGNLRDMIKNIVGIGSDVEKNYATQCGSILIEEMTVAGQN